MNDHMDTSSAPEGWMGLGGSDQPGHGQSARLPPKGPNGPHNGPLFDLQSTLKRRSFAAGSFASSPGPHAQNENFSPSDMLRGAATFVGSIKNGEVITPL